MVLAALKLTCISLKALEPQSNSVVDTINRCWVERFIRRVVFGCLVFPLCHASPRTILPGQDASLCHLYLRLKKRAERQQRR
jgi:hypothetical protein